MGGVAVALVRVLRRFAVESGFSCNLLKSDMEIMILSADNKDAARSQIEGGLNKIASVLGPPSLSAKRRGFVPGAQAAFAVVIDGDTLRHALSPELKSLFLTLSTQCETVVCCRVSPAQKALVVKLVRSQTFTADVSGHILNRDIYRSKKERMR